jgi:replicative DNA helicase
MNRTAKSTRRPDDNPTAMFDGTPPHSLEAEKGVLGSILLQPAVADDIALTLRPDDFYAPNHRKLYEVMFAIHNAGKTVDTTLIVNKLKTSGDFDAMGGMKFLLDVAESVPTHHNAVHYATIVAEKASLRNVLTAAYDTISDVTHNDGLDVRSILASAEARIFACAERRVAMEAQDLTNVLVNAMAAINENAAGVRIGLDTGYEALDALTGGMRPGQLIIIAARPGLGKSAFSTNVAENVASQGGKVLIVSMEMSAIEIGQRLLSAHGHIAFHHLTNNQMTNGERTRLTETSSELAALPIRIDDQSQRTVTEIAAQCRRMKRREGLDLLIVDYLTLITPENDRDQREEQVAKIARRLKTLAREIGIPVLCLAQLNREVAKGNDNRPQLHHLRSSGAIEQDADQVWFVHREEYYETNPAEKQRLKHQAEIIVSKARNGRQGTAELYWEPKWGRFENKGPDQQQQPVPPPPPPKPTRERQRQEQYDFD